MVVLITEALDFCDKGALTACGDLLSYFIGRLVAHYLVEEPPAVRFNKLAPEAIFTEVS